MANRYVSSFSLSNSNWALVTAGAAGLTVRRVELSLATSFASANVNTVPFTAARLSGVSGGFSVPMSPIIDGNPVSALATATGNATASSVALARWDVPITASVHEFDFEGDAGITVAPSDSFGVSASLGANNSAFVNIWFEV